MNRSNHSTILTLPIQSAFRRKLCFSPELEDDALLHKVLNDCLKGIAEETAALAALEGPILPALLELFITLSGTRFPSIIFTRHEKAVLKVSNDPPKPRSADVFAFAASFLLGFMKHEKCLHFFDHELYATYTDKSDLDASTSFAEFISTVIDRECFSDNTVKSGVFTALASIVYTRSVRMWILDCTKFYDAALLLTQQETSYHVEQTAKGFLQEFICACAEARGL